MSIEAANTFPDFLKRPRITAEQLRQVQDPCLVFEHHWLDSDGQQCWGYTVGGLLNGKPLGGLQGGATVGGEIVIVHAATRQDADAIASLGLQDTLQALEDEADAYIEAHAAMARMASVNPLRRHDLATAAPADKSDEFERDAEAIRKLRGDDIVLTTGGVDDAQH